MVILAIETSCDETAIAILENGKVIINDVYSQIEFHAKYGGVIPEMASRMHAERLTIMIDNIKNNYDFTKIDYIAYTSEPGLQGSLQVGATVARALSLVLNKPLIPINHLHGHIFAGNIDNEYKYPFLSLLVSGGHTQLVLVDNNLNFKIIAQTRDDSIGEVFDKISRVLGFEYPGGPVIDRLARNGNKTINFPIPLNKNASEFSFSGLKTAVVNYVNNSKKEHNELLVNDIAASFQFAAIEALITKTKIAIQKYKPKIIVLSGGVASNSFLRSRFLEINPKVIIPKLEYCTDNAAMIAKACEVLIIKKKFNAPHFDLSFITSK